MVNKNLIGYGIGDALPQLAPPPIIASRDPKTTDHNYPIGQVWINQSAPYVLWTLMRIASNSASWRSMAPALGQATLVAGTVTVSDTSLTASDYVLVTRADANASTGIGSLEAVVTGGTGVTFNSLDATASVETGDTSIINYAIFRVVA